MVSNSSPPPPHLLSIPLPPGPLGVVIEQGTSTDGQPLCVVSDKTDADAAFPLQANDVIVSLNGINLSGLKGGGSAWVKLFQAYATGGRNLMVQRRSIIEIDVSAIDSSAPPRTPPSPPPAAVKCDPPPPAARSVASADDATSSITAMALSDGGSNATMPSEHPFAVLPSTNSTPRTAESEVEPRLTSRIPVSSAESSDALDDVSNKYLDRADIENSINNERGVPPAESNETPNYVAKRHLNRVDLEVDDNNERGGRAEDSNEPKEAESCASSSCSSESVYSHIGNIMSLDCIEDPDISRGSGDDGNSGQIQSNLDEEAQIIRGTGRFHDYDFEDQGFMDDDYLNEPNLVAGPEEEMSSMDRTGSIIDDASTNYVTEYLNEPGLASGPEEEMSSIDGDGSIIDDVPKTSFREYLNEPDLVAGPEEEMSSIDGAGSIIDDSLPTSVRDYLNESDLVAGPDEEMPSIDGAGAITDDSITTSFREYLNQSGVATGPDEEMPSIDGAEAITNDSITTSFREYLNQPGVVPGSDEELSRIDGARAIMDDVPTASTGEPLNEPGAVAGPEVELSRIDGVGGINNDAQTAAMMEYLKRPAVVAAVIQYLSAGFQHSGPNKAFEVSSRSKTIDFRSDDTDQSCEDDSPIPSISPVTSSDQSNNSHDEENPNNDLDRDQGALVSADTNSEQFKSNIEEKSNIARVEGVEHTADPAVIDVPKDLFSMFYIAEAWHEHLPSIFVFALQIAILSLILKNLIETKNIPVDVEIEVTIAQYFACLVSVFTADDFVNGVLFFQKRILREDADLHQNEGREQPSKPPISIKWEISNIMRMIEGFLVIVVSFVFIVQSVTVIELFLNFAGVLFVSQLDDAYFRIAERHLLGLDAGRLADKVSACKANLAGTTKFYDGQKMRWRFIVRSSLIAALTIGMWIGLTYFVRKQDAPVYN